MQIQDMESFISGLGSRAAESDAADMDMDSISVAKGPALSCTWVQQRVVPGQEISP